MKTASVKGPSIISVDETEKPVLNSGDILVQMHACGIGGLMMSTLLTLVVIPVVYLVLDRSE